MIDLTPGRPARLLDIARGRSGTVLSRWLAARDDVWRGQVSTASLDPFRGYASALAAEPPAARRVLDPAHVVRLGLDAVDQVRRRFQQDTAAGPETRSTASDECCAGAPTGSPSGPDSASNWDWPAATKPGRWPAPGAEPKI